MRDNFSDRGCYLLVSVSVLEVDANASLGTMPVMDDAIGGEDGNDTLGSTGSFSLILGEERPF
jgi:hypothetical protein